jgi:ankyrin repeat protein
VQYKTTLNKWLDPVPAIDDFERIKNNRLDGSCEWIKIHREFGYWLQYGQHRILHIEGQPGCGKSTVATRIIELCQTRGPTAYFFCDFNDPNRQTWNQILRTWTWQLLLQKSYLVGDVFKVYAETCGTTTPDASFQRALHAVLGQSVDSFLIVDGLDELRHPDHSRISSHILGLAKAAKLLIISRREPWIENALLKQSPYVLGRISVLPAYNEGDIGKWVNQQVQSLNLDAETTERVSRSLISGAKGMFLWARLMFRHISQQSTLAEISAALSDLPDGLDNVYIRILQRISNLPPSRLRIAQRTIQWTLSAMRPLSIQELAIALMVQPGSDHHDPRDMIPNLETILLDSCAPLLEFNESRGAITFVHTSATEFLKRRASDPIVKMDLCIPASPRNDYIAAVCLTYLAYEDIDFVNPDLDFQTYDDNLALCLQRHPFLEYCVLNWWKHMPDFDNIRTCKCKVLTESVARFSLSQKSITKWIQLFQLLDGPRKGKLQENEAFHPEDPRCATLFDANSFLQNVRESSSQLFVRWDRWLTETFFNGRHSWPISIASFFDFAHVVKSELSRGVNVNSADFAGFTPLLYAAHGDAPNTSQLLLEKKADVQATTRMNLSLSRYASRNGITVLPLLLDAGAPISLKGGGYGRTTLHSACSVIGWHPSVLKELLKRSTAEDLEETDNFGMTPIHLAAAIDIEKSVGLMLGRFLQSNTTGSQRRLVSVSTDEAFTPSSLSTIQAWATAWNLELGSENYIIHGGDDLKRNMTILARLIKLSILESVAQLRPRVDTIDDFGQTALHLAAETGFDSDVSPTDTDADRVVEILLAMGSSVEARNHKNQTAVDVAVMHGHWTTVMALLRADTSNSTLSTSCTALLERLRTEKHKKKHGVGVADSLTEAAGIDFFSDSHPNSPLEVFQAAHILDQQLLATTYGNFPTERQRSQIISAILDDAEYWTPSAGESRRGNGSSSSTSFSASVVVGRGKVRRIEIYVLKAAINGLERRAHYRVCERPSYQDMRYLPRQRSFDMLPEMRKKPSGRNFQDEGALLKLVRHPGNATRSAGERPASDGTTAIQLVSPVSSLWKISHRWDPRAEYAAWKQTWPWGEETIYSQYVNGESVEEQRNRIAEWMSNLQEGDEIVLLPADQFSVQDVALYSSFGVVVYTSWL